LPMASVPDAGDLAVRGGVVCGGPEDCAACGNVAAGAPEGREQAGRPSDSVGYSTGSQPNHSRRSKRKNDDEERPNPPNRAPRQVGRRGWISHSLRPVVVACGGGQQARPGKPTRPGSTSWNPANPVCRNTRNVRWPINPSNVSTPRCRVDPSITASGAFGGYRGTPPPGGGRRRNGVMYARTSDFRNVQA